jgi:hypothetical protein
VLLAGCSSCSEPRPGAGGAEGLQPVQDESCLRLLEQIRATRDGPQPCGSMDECVVWHNGENWDGCPPEVNRKNAKQLDAMRAKLEMAGCTVGKVGTCPPRPIRGCVEGECGKEPRFIHRMTAEQQGQYDKLVEEAQKTGVEKVKTMGETVDDPE